MKNKTYAPAMALILLLGMALAILGGCGRAVHLRQHDRSPIHTGAYPDARAGAATAPQPLPGLLGPVNDHLAPLVIAAG